MPPKLIYFDRNIYNTIKKQLVATTADYDLIKRGIALGVIMIPGSLVVLEEALPIYRSKSPTLLALEKQIYSEIMSWKVFIKYHAELLRDEIVAYINKTQFTPFTTAYNITPDNWFTTNHAQSYQWEQILPTIEAEKNKLSESLKDIRQSFERNLQKIQKNEKRRMTISSLWQEQAKNFAKEYASRYELLNLTEQQIEGLLNLRSLGAVIRYDIAYFYKKFKLGEQIRASDSRDHHHVALIAVTDIFVTEDIQFRDILGLIPIPNYTVLSYKRFIKWLSMTLAGWQSLGASHTPPRLDR